VLADRAGEDQPDRVVFGVLLDLGTVGAASSQLIAVPMSVRVRVGSSRQARGKKRLPSCLVPRRPCPKAPKSREQRRPRRPGGIIALRAQDSPCWHPFIEVKIELSWLPR